MPRHFKRETPMKHCELVPGKGIRHGDHDIFFGLRRNAVRKVLGKPVPNDSMWNDEDEYEVDGDEWLRLRYLDDTLCDIEVLGGSLAHDGVELKHTDIRTLKAGLNNCGIAVDDLTEWLSEGRDCVDLQIVVATGDDIGEPGGDKIAWVITSVDFKVE